MSGRNDAIKSNNIRTELPDVSEKADEVTFRKQLELRVHKVVSALIRFSVFNIVEIYTANVYRFREDKIKLTTV